MASIPRYRQGQRLEPMGPNQENSPQAARMEGEALANFGESLQKFAPKLDTYMRVREATNDAILAKQYKDKADITAQDAEVRIRTNKDGNVALDGGNMMELYDASFQGLYDEAAGIQDRKKRQVALTSIGNARNIYRGQIADASVAHHNTYMFSETEKSIRTMGAKIANDPNRFQTDLDEMKAHINTLPMGIENKQKILLETEKRAALAVLQHHKSKNNHDMVDKLIEGELAPYFNEEERIKLFEQNETDEREDLRFKWAKENEHRAGMREAKEDARIAELTSLQAALMNGNDSDKEVALASARSLVNAGVLNTSDISNIIKGQEEFETVNSGEITSEYTRRLIEKDDLSSFVDDVMSDPSVTGPHRTSLLNHYAKMKQAKKTNDPVYKNKFSHAVRFVYDAFPMDKADILGEKDAERRAKRAKSVEVFLQKTNNIGADPFEEARKAIRVIDPNNEILNQMEKGDGGRLPEAISKERGELEHRYLQNKAGMSPAQKRMILNKLEQLDMELKAQKYGRTNKQRASEKRLEKRGVDGN